MSDTFRGILNQPRPDLPTQNPRVVLVTGATSGIGHATTLLLVSLGHKVTATGRREERLQALHKDCDGMLGELFTYPADVLDSKAMLNSVAQTLARFGRLDVLVANAGLGHRGALADANWEDLETVLDTNIKGVLHSIRACVPAFRASGGGHIITISSVLGPVPTPFAAIYGASKAAVDSIAQALRGELKADNIHVTNMLIGQTHTEFAEKRLGHSGRVSSKVPTMPAEKVALHVVRAMDRRKRSIILRPFDRALVMGGRFFPQIMDRLLAKIYQQGDK